LNGAVTVPIAVDHGQFLVRDHDALLDIDAYDEHSTRDGLALWGDRGGVTVFTASHWTHTDVTVRLEPQRPAIASADWDHLVEGGIVVPSGRLHLYGPEDTVSHEVSIAVPPGEYSLIACGRDFASTNEYGDEGRDRYALILWPGPPLRRRVLKDGFEQH
jgi:hypothetical protein